MKASKISKVLNVIAVLIMVSGFSFGFMLLFGLNANAYIDPSALSYMIQVVAGLVIGGTAVFGVYWQKMKKVFMETFKIDASSKDIIESDDIHVHY